MFTAKENLLFNLENFNGLRKTFCLQLGSTWKTMIGSFRSWMQPGTPERR